MIFVRTFLLLAHFSAILSASSQHDLGFCPDHLKQKMFILHFVLFWAFSCSIFWVLGVGRPVSLKNPNNPVLGWPKTLSNNDNDLRYSPPAWRRGSAKSSKTRGHLDNQVAAYSGVSEQGPFCLFIFFIFLSFCLSILATETRRNSYISYQRCSKTTYDL